MKILSRLVASLAGAFALAAGAAPLTNVVAIEAGGLQTCALTSAGGVTCWGAAWDADPVLQAAPAPVDVPGLASGVSALAVGHRHACALLSSGAVKCWGQNDNGQVGDGTNLFRTTPVDVSGLASGVTAITAGVWHTCALMAAGTVKCWGDNGSGQIGDESFVDRTVPVDVARISAGAVAISAGGFHTCALLGSGALKCWGANEFGQLGVAGGGFYSAPIDVPDLAIGVAAISAGTQHTCALVAGNGVKCWGYNALGQLGDGLVQDRSTPAFVSGHESASAAVSAGGFHSCALGAGGSVDCWGGNLFKQLADATTTNRPTPVPIDGLAGGAAEIDAGGQHACALTSAGTVKCWGDNALGQLGNGNVGGSFTGATTVGTFTAQTIAFANPGQRDVAEGSFPVAATATSGLPVTLRSLSTHVCTVSGSTVTLVAIGLCKITADQPGDETYGAAPMVLQRFRVVDAAASTAARLVNLATRMMVLGGNDMMIGGFVIGGSLPKTVVIRARGPSLAAAGVANPTSFPELQLFSGTTQLQHAHFWRGHPSATDVEASGLAPTDNSEPAILSTLAPGAYTVKVFGRGGVGIFEVFEIDRPESPLLNVSTRGFARTGDEVMIGGFVIEGSGPQTVVVRARGPSLSAFGVTGVLANPTLRLVRSSDGSTIATNDNWGDASNAAAITASGFAPSDAAESAILVTLDPGAYTAIVSGVAGSTGVAIVEVFRQ